VSGEENPTAETVHFPPGIKCLPAQGDGPCCCRVRQFFLGLPRESSWDDLIKPPIYLGNKVDLYTVPLGLNSLFVKFNPIAGGEGDFQYIVTAALLATIPMIGIFLVGQRYFVEGIATTGRKG